MEEKKLRIGAHEVETRFEESSIDEFLYTVESTGNPSVKYLQKFFPRYLDGVTGASFPDSVDLSIYQVKTSFRHITALSVRKLNGECYITNEISLDHSSWDLPESLGNFVDRYTEGLKDTGRIEDVSTSRTEYGFDLTCRMDVPDTQDIYSRIRELERTQETVYRNLIVKPSEPDQKYGEERRHWWIRYVVVPLIGSGTVAAVLVKYLLQ